jgi:hypothetical protein
MWKGMYAGQSGRMVLMNEIKLNKRKEIERVAYLVGKYFTGEITLKYFKIQINSIEEPIMAETTAS